MFRGALNRSVFAGFLGLALLASVLIPVTAALASTVSLAPAVGSGYATSTASQFGIRITHPEVSVESGTQLGIEILDPNGGLDPRASATFISPLAVRHTLSSDSGYLASSFPVAAKTIHPGGLLPASSQVTFDLAGSPYHFESTLEIPPSTSLVVEAGVVLDFSQVSGPAIWAQGNLDMQGTHQEPIRVSGPRYWDSFIKLAGADGNWITISNSNFTSSTGRIFGSSNVNSLITVTESEFSGFSSIGYLYEPSTWNIQRNVFVDCGDAALYGSAEDVIVDNIFIGSSSLSIRSPGVTVQGNDFSKMQNPIRIYADANLQGNYWGTTSLMEIGEFVLDDTDSLEYSSVDFSLPLATPSVDSPVGPSNSVLASYLGDLLSGSFLILRPGESQTETFTVQVRAFLDTDGNGAFDDGETTSAFTSITFLSLNSAELVSDLSLTSGSFLGTSIGGYISFGTGVNGHQVERSSFSLQRLNASSSNWESIEASLSSGSEAYFYLTVAPIESDIQIRALVSGQGLTRYVSALREVNDNSGITLSLSAPSTVAPGSTLTVEVRPKDSDGNPVSVTSSSIAKLTYAMDGLGLGMSTNPFYTNYSGVAKVNIALGANDIGPLTVTVTFDPDGDLGSREQVSQSVSIYIGNPGTLVENADTGDKYLLEGGIRYLIPPGYVELLGVLGQATTVPASFLDTYARGHDFAGIMRNQAINDLLLHANGSLETIPDCFLAAQFGVQCELAVTFSESTISSLKQALSIVEVPNLSFAELGQLLTPTLKIEGVPGLGNNISASILGVQSETFTSISWIRLGLSDTVLKRDRVTYTVQADDLGKEILFEVVSRKPGYVDNIVRSASVTPSSVADPIPWVAPTIPRVIIPSMPSPPNPVVENAPTEVFASWTKNLGDGTAKIYAKNLVGEGKVQFFLNGVEIAWVRAVSESDPALRIANGSAYLVRTVNFQIGKNVLEVFVDGVRTTRTAYTW